MNLFDEIRSAGQGQVVAALAKEAGVEHAEAEKALRTLLPELGRAIRRRGESGSESPAIDAALHDDGYERYLDHPAALGEPAAATAGERVLTEVLDQGQRQDLVRGVAAALGQSESAIRAMVPLVATLALAVLGKQVREPSPSIPWYGTRQSDRFGAPLLNALAALFEHDEYGPPKERRTPPGRA